MPQPSARGIFPLFPPFTEINAARRGVASPRKCSRGEMGGSGGKRGCTAVSLGFRGVVFPPGQGGTGGKISCVPIGGRVHPPRHEAHLFEPRPKAGWPHEVIRYRTAPLPCGPCRVFTGTGRRLVSAEARLRATGWHDLTWRPYRSKAERLSQVDTGSLSLLYLGRVDPH